MTDDKKQKFQERMAALHEKYCNQLPGKYQAIEDSWKECRSDLSNQDSLELFYRLIHTLKGTAATFGFVKQADSCFAIQKLLIDAKENQLTLSEDLVPLIDRSIQKLKASMDEPAEDILG